MKIYDCRTLQRHLGVGRDTAYAILKSHGFRIGQRTLRITDKQLTEYVKGQKDAEKV